MRNVGQICFLMICLVFGSHEQVSAQKNSATYKIQLQGGKIIRGSQFSQKGDFLLLEDKEINIDLIRSIGIYGKRPDNSVRVVGYAIIGSVVFASIARTGISCTDAWLFPCWDRDFYTVVAGTGGAIVGGLIGYLSRKKVIKTISFNTLETRTINHKLKEMNDLKMF